MAEAIVGGNIRYPSLESIASLFRAQINDTFSGSTNTPGEGLIMYDQNPDLITFGWIRPSETCIPTCATWAIQP